MTKAERAKELLQSITSEMHELNEICQTLPFSLRRQFELYERYAFGAIGSPGINFNSIIGPEPEKRALIPQPHNIDREAYRDMLRRQKMPEPMIWERWPAHNNDEKNDMYQRLAAYNGSRERSELINAAPHDPFGQYMRSEARKVAKKTGQEYKDILTNANFQKKCKEMWDAVDELIL